MYKLELRVAYTAGLGTFAVEYFHGLKYLRLKIFVVKIIYGGNFLGMKFFCVNIFSLENFNG